MCSIIIPSFIFGTERHGFFLKDTALAPHRYYPRHFVVTACFASSRLSYIFQYFNISIFQYFKKSGGRPGISATVSPCKTILCYYK